MLFEIDLEAQRGFSQIMRTMEMRKGLQGGKEMSTRRNKVNTSMEKQSYSSGNSE